MSNQYSFQSKNLLPFYRPFSTTPQRSIKNIFINSKWITIEGGRKEYFQNPNLQTQKYRIWRYSIILLRGKWRRRKILSPLSHFFLLGISHCDLFSIKKINFDWKNKIKNKIQIRKYFFLCAEMKLDIGIIWIESSVVHKLEDCYWTYSRYKCTWL